jgi:hypothetical protein
MRRNFRANRPTMEDRVVRDPKFQKLLDSCRSGELDLLSGSRSKPPKHGGRAWPASSARFTQREGTAGRFDLEEKIRTARSGS